VIRTALAGGTNPAPGADAVSTNVTLTFKADALIVEGLKLEPKRGE
jgi:hypothetical protein